MLKIVYKPMASRLWASRYGVSTSADIILRIRTRPLVRIIAEVNDLLPRKKRGLFRQLKVARDRDVYYIRNSNTIPGFLARWCLNTGTRSFALSYCGLEPAITSQGPTS